MSLLDGQAAVVTGAARGIGFAIASAFVDHGASVLVADRDGDQAARAVRELGPRAVATCLDVVKQADVAAAMSRCVDEFGSLDILVNNAGITRDATMRKMTLDDFAAVLEVNLTGTWLATKAAAPIMSDRGRGAVVNISSIAGKVGNFGQTNYSAAKSGIVGLTKAAAKELARFGVRVNAVQPGLITTPMTENLPQHVLDKKLAEIPMGRPGTAAEVATAVLFLASDLASYVTGAVLEVTGGRYM